MLLNKKITILATLIWAILIFIGSSIPSQNLPGSASGIDYLIHFFEYFVLGLLLILSFRKNSINLKIVWLVLGIGLIYAFSDEIHQLFVLGRQFDLFDLLADFVGFTMGVWVVLMREKFKVVKK